MGWRILFDAKMKETINHRLRFNRTGFGIILFETVIAVLLVYGSKVIFADIKDETVIPGVVGLLFIMNLLIILGNSYILSEKMLFGFQGKVDVFLNADPKDVLLSAVVYTFLSNLRPIIQSPAITAMVLVYLWFPENLHIYLSLLVLIPILGTIAAAFTVIIIKRFFNRISGLGLIPTTVLNMCGLGGTAWIITELVNGSIGLKLPWIDSPLYQPVMMWPIYLIFCSMVLLLILIKKAKLWEEAFGIQEDQACRRVGKNQAGRILLLLSFLRFPAPVKAVILKEWLCVWRNPLTLFRIVIWLIVLMALLFKVPSFLRSSLSPLLIVFIIWLFCFGELVATVYQSETNRLGLLWLAAISPKQLALGKLLAYIPLVFTAAVTAGLIGLIFELAGKPYILLIYYSIAGVILGMVLSLAAGVFSMNKLANQGTSVTEMAFEQVPLTFAGIISLVVLSVVLILFSIVNNWSASITLVVVLGVLGLVITTYFLKRQYSL